MKVNQEGMEPSIKPKKIYRLGKYDQEKATQGSSRPIKIELMTEQDQATIMGSAKNLKGADATFKNVNVTYDLSQTEREELNLLLQSASEKSKNSTEYVYKVRGTPGNMEIIRFKRRS